MNGPHGWPLTTTGAVLMIAGLTLLAASPTRTARQMRAPRRAAGVAGALASTVLGGGVIAAVEWLILSRIEPGTVWVAVLTVPAFLAAATVTRLVLVARTVAVRRRWWAIRSDRGCRR